jgi:DHA1 family bicyclomycin/chloramphenicol resistance-like MFS transporter
MGLAPILAPLAGGQILVLFGWRAIFWTLGVFGLLCLTAVLLGLGESLPSTRRSTGGVWEAIRVYGQLLRDRSFMRYNVSGALAISGMFVYIFGSPFVFMQIHGVRPDHYGWLFGLNALGLISASQLNRALLRRVANTEILSRALVVTALGGVWLLAAAWTGAAGLPGLLLPLFVYIARTVSNMNAIRRRSPRRRASVIAT